MLDAIMSTAMNIPDRTHSPAGSDLVRVWTALRDVFDPEIPSLSVVDLGVIARVCVDDGAATIDMTPTFAGCPALDVMRQRIHDAVIAAGFEPVTVNTVFDPPWSTDRLTELGRQRLKEFGLAPPSRVRGPFDEKLIANVNCPFCDSTDTSLESIFGPALCRSIHYCNACRQSFEQFKPVD